jgi:hypothetical protein
MTRDAGPQAESEQKPPVLKIIKGNPTPEEVAALVTVISSLTTDEVQPEKRRTPEWSAPHRLVRAPCSPSPTGWRSSSLPHG